MGIDKTVDPLNSTIFLGPKFPVNPLLYLFPRRDTRLVIDVEVEEFFAKKRQRLVMIPLDALNIGPGL
jgi:hypothetical protein